MAKTAIFGRTFDPIHSAHLLVGSEARRAFQLDKVLLVPAGTPPHKEGPEASFEDRLAMVKLACQGMEGFEVSDVERDGGKSYSIFTIEKLRKPGETLYFVIGADAFAELQTWYRWKDVAAAVEFIVVTRPGHVYEIPEGAVAHTLATVDEPISSSEVRRKIAAGVIPEEIPAPVRRYIEERKLYGISGRVR